MKYSKLRKHMTNKVLLCTFIGAMTGTMLSACGGGGGGDKAAESPTQPKTSTPTTSTIEQEFSLWLTDLGNNVILPDYKMLAEKAQALSTASNSFCQLDTPMQTDLVSLRNSWRDANLSWQKIQWVKIGPILDHHRNLRMQQWPEGVKYISRDIANLLAEQTLVDADYVAKSSVSGQGIPALEYLLFPQSTQDTLINLSSDNNQAKRCEIVMAISENIFNISTDVYQAWQSSGGNYIHTMTTGTGEFTGPVDVVEEIVTILLEQLEKVKDDKMLIPLADADDLALTEFYLSDQSLASIKVNIRSFKDIYSAGDGHGFDDILVGFLKQQNIANDMTDKVNTAITAVEVLSGDYSVLLKDDEGRVNIENTIQMLRELRNVISVDFVQATDINIGFNSNDGD